MNFYILSSYNNFKILIIWNKDTKKIVYSKTYLKFYARFYASLVNFGEIIIICGFRQRVTQLYD